MATFCPSPDGACAPRTYLHRGLALALLALLGGCASCNQQEFLQRLAYYDGIDANWEPGEFDMVDRQRAFRRQLREDTLKRGDYTAGCKALDEYMDRDRIKGSH